MNQQPVLASEKDCDFNIDLNVVIQIERLIRFPCRVMSICFLSQITMSTFTHAPMVGLGGDLVKAGMRVTLIKAPECLIYQHLHTSKWQQG